MSYIGNVPTTRYTTISKQTITGNGGTSYALNVGVANEQELEVFVNNVRQEPGVAYTASGTTLNMTGTVGANDSFYVVFQGKAQSTVTIPEKQASGDYLFNGNVIVGNASSNVRYTSSSIIFSDSSSIGTAQSLSIRNRIINGEMLIDQRNAGAAQTITAAAALAYTVDRWYAYCTGANEIGRAHV